MKYLPITLLATLSASLLMALIFAPTLGAYIGRPGTADADRSGGDDRDRPRLWERGPQSWFSRPLTMRGREARMCWPRFWAMPSIQMLTI